MVILKRFGNAWSHIDLSMFCSKVQTYLRMANVEVRDEVADTRKMPKQKLPVVDDGGQLICDSRDIVAHFEAKLAEPVDAHLSAPQRALLVAFRALIEEEYYFYLLYARWQQDDGWERYKPHLMAYGKQIGVPAFAIPVVMRMVRKGIVQSIQGQGIGRHSVEEAKPRMREIISALSTQLGDNSYMLGDTPSTLDASAYPAVEGMLHAEFGPSLQPVQDFARAQANLVQYYERMTARYFPEVGQPADAKPAGNHASPATA